MRRALVPLFTALLIATAIAEQPARLGRLLSKSYPLMTESETAVVIVYLKDKGVRGRTALFSARELLSARAIARRAKVRPAGKVIDEGDLPVDRSYVEAITGTGVEFRHALKWFNAVSAVATRAQIDALRKLPFVKEIELVGRWRVKAEIEQPWIDKGDSPHLASGTTSLDYGSSITQNAQINVTKAHDLGIYGEGTVVGVFDNGFRLLSHEAFDSMNIIAQYDFVDKKASVIPDNPSGGFGAHGVNTLSTVGGYKPGQLIGPAFGADYILARTENDSSETPLEEDNWAAAIEWADSIGVDVTSTSLGYIDYDSPYPSWTWQDMDGNTTLITRAADHAVSLGIIVITSAGNQYAGNGVDNTLLAPADGDSVMAAGAVNSLGTRASFSSVGPTTDVPPRIKPDIMAMGVAVRVASSSNPVNYGSANGTSFACPLSAGVASLILSANPGLDPIQVRDAMRNTADNAASPNNLYGWGILNADSALKYWGIVPMAKISGTLFHDINGNGILDGSDVTLPGRDVLLTGDAGDTVVTGSGGEFDFGALAIGTYGIAPSLAPGWTTTTPPESLNFAMLHRDAISGLLVGIYEAGTISGTIFDDLDSNGTRDIGEAGIPGRTVRLTGVYNDSTVTDTGGAYLFSGIPPGSYQVRQDPEPDWVQTLPAAYGKYGITVTSGYDSGSFDFGNFYSPVGAYPVSAGWNLLSLPSLMDAPLADSLYPGALSALFGYDSAYKEVDTIQNGRGYWAKFAAPQYIFLPGLERTADTLDLVAGWNLIGTLSEPVDVSSLVQEPDTLVESGFFGFSVNAYTKLASDGMLMPHRGYWIKCRVAGRLILTAPPSGE